MNNNESLSGVSEVLSILSNEVIVELNSKYHDALNRLNAYQKQIDSLEEENNRLADMIFNFKETLKNKPNNDSKAMIKRAIREAVDDILNSHLP